MKLLQPHQLTESISNRRIVDVRTPVEFNEVHIHGSRLLPLHEFNEVNLKALQAEDGTCVLVCRSGSRAKQAAEKLMAAGCKEVEVLEGGVAAWEAAGLPVNRGKKSLSIERQVRIAAGSLVVIGIVLALTINPLFLILSGFVGCGLVFAGVTDWCGMGLLLAQMPWNNRGTSCHAAGGKACAS